MARLPLHGRGAFDLWYRFRLLGIVVFQLEGRSAGVFPRQHTLASHLIGSVQPGWWYDRRVYCGPLANAVV